MVSDLIDQNLRDYQLSEQIGQGMMTVVFKGRRLADDRQVAIKILPNLWRRDPGFIERFETGTQLISKLEHPNILPIYDYGQTEDGTTYLVMQYVNGGTLADLFELALPLDKVCRLFLTIAEAVAYAHAHDVIHRDLTPSNILFDDHGHLYVADFGLAQIMAGERSVTGSMILGTPAYMAPEQSEGLTADKRTDIYALGVMLYEMITRQRPFEAETPMAVMLKEMSEIFPLPHQLRPDLPDEVEQVILKALATNPNERYQDVKQFSQALQQATGYSLKPTDKVTATGSMASAPQAPSIPAAAPAVPTPGGATLPWLWITVAVVILMVILGVIFIGIGG